MKTNVMKFCHDESWDYGGLIESLKTEFSPLGEGRHRVVFELSKYFVIKAPKSILGLEDNWYEGRMSGDRLCKCRLYKNVLLVMERVVICSPESCLPRWTYGIDCQQVGFNKFGKLKAYDFGIN